MSEGGTLPWKTQKVENQSPPLHAFIASLPPPPVGWYWERCEEEASGWLLKKFTKQKGEEASPLVVFQSFSCIQHIVMPQDTLQGICLKYNIKAVDLRRHNTFSGSNIQTFKVLRIPVEAGQTAQLQETTPEVLIQCFKNETNESAIEARFYLEEAEWDLDKALADFRSDDKFAKKTEADAAAAAAAAAPRIVPAAKIDESVVTVAPHAIVNTQQEVELCLLVSSSTHVFDASASVAASRVPLLG